MPHPPSLLVLSAVHALLPQTCASLRRRVRSEEPHLLFVFNLVHFPSPIIENTPNSSLHFDVLDSRFASAS